MKKKACLYLSAAVLVSVSTSLVSTSVCAVETMDLKSRFRSVKPNMELYRKNSQEDLLKSVQLTDVKDALQSDVKKTQDLTVSSFVVVDVPATPENEQEIKRLIDAQAKATKTSFWDIFTLKGLKRIFGVKEKIQ